jgi:hypothetical protein
VALVLRPPIDEIRNPAPAVPERGGARIALSAGNPPLVRFSPPPHKPVHRKKGQVSGYDHPVSWIYVLSHFDGTERWVSFWFSFGARLSREPFFDIIPG